MGSKNYATDANTVVKFFLANSFSGLTQKQIHKLLFFAYLEYLKENNKDANALNNLLFENKFQAWIHGPVHTAVYPLYADFGGGLIDNKQRCEIKNKVLCKFLFSILEKYKNEKGEILSGDALEYHSHHNSAWIKARGSKQSWEPSTTAIIDKDIFESEIPQIKVV
jgi:uncharacterized phage-associated protein